MPGAISGVTWHLLWAAGRHRGAPSCPSCSRELGCEPALYRQRVPGGFRRCWSRDAHPSLHPGSAAPQRVLTALPHFRAVPPPHPTASHPCRPLSPGTRPCHQPAGAAAAPPLCHGTAGAAGLPGFPCPPSTAVSREVDTDLEPRCGPGAGHTGWGLGRAGMVGHRAGNRAWRERGPYVPAPPRLQGHILALASASPCWLILLGSRWGSGGAGISSSALPVPQIFFLRVMFLVLIPFAFSQLSRPVAYHRHR